jgi:hypothetical protein
MQEMFGYILSGIVNIRIHREKCSLVWGRYKKTPTNL